jgi:ubiquinone/menaquinone biosynthesis C-methylase UbiE
MTDGAKPSALDAALEAIAAERGLRIVGRVGTAAEHEKFWSAYDWSERGYEWGTREFVRSMVRSSLAIGLRPGIRVLEIGPGAGRLTELLLGEDREVVLADISRKCLDQTLERFADYPRLRALWVREGLTGLDLEPGSVDFVASFDAFVHFDHATTAAYLARFKELMKVGAYGCIHHPDTRKAGGWRGDVNLASFNELLVANDFIPLAHTRFVDERVNLLGHFDYVTLFARGLRELFSERLDRAARGELPGAEVIPL